MNVMPGIILFLNYGIFVCEQRLVDAWGERGGTRLESGRDG